MNSRAYRAGGLAVHQLLGLEKRALAAEPTTVTKGLTALHRLIPETRLGQGAALGGLLGLGMGTHMLMDDRRQPGTQMEYPLIVPGGPLPSHPPRY